MGIFSFVKAGGKRFATIKSVKPNVPKTETEKLKSKLNILKQKTKGAKANLEQTLFENKQKRIYSGKELEQQEYFKDMNKTKKAKGGRVGLRFGTKKKSNVQKIKETFGPKQKPQSRMTRKKKFPDLTGDGKVTFADILKGRGVINGKKKKKVI